MGTKRDYEEVGSPDPEPEVSERQTFNKKRKFGSKTKHRPSEGTTGWAKKRARNIERLLKKNQELPANVKNDLERELAAHTSTVTDKAFQKKRSAMISKYHMVRFFERKKALRLAKQIQKRLEQGESDAEADELRRHLHIVQVDEAYAKHFPHAEVYISLYPNTKDDGGDDKEEKAAKTKVLIEAPRPSMWSLIEEALQEGPEALNRIRERRSADGAASSTTASKSNTKPAKSTTKTPKTAAKAPAPVKLQPKEKALPNGAKPEGMPGMNRRERRAAMRKLAPAVPEDDDESDGGGFFEE